MTSEHKDAQVTSHCPPLTGLRVIEVGAFIAGPYCCQLLADFGAEVIKIEPPGDGDPMRQWGSQKLADLSLWWPVIGRNKKCITLDLRLPEGQTLARKLIGSADVLVENFRPGTLEKWNLAPDALRLENPKLIAARVSGFGQSGPYSFRAGFASVAEAMGGLRYLTGYPDRPPTRVGLSIGDSLAGIFAALGVMTALYERDAGRSGGRGQDVDVAITESVLAILEGVLSEYGATGAIRERSGPILPGIAPSNLYPTRDSSWIVVGANSDSLFRRLSVAMGEPTLAETPNYATHSARAAHQVQLDEVIARWTTTKTSDEALTLLLEHGVPAGPVYDAAGVSKDPHFREREAVVDVSSGEFGTVTMQGVVPKLSHTPGAIRWTGGKLGTHNDEVYAGVLGLSPRELADLKARGIV